MIEIDIQYETNSDDNFNSEYIYIKNLQTLLDSDFDSSNNEIIKVINRDNIANYQQLPCYVNSTNTLDSLLELGSIFITKFNITNIDNFNFIHENYNELKSIVMTWLKENPYPYNDFNNFYAKFADDCIRCYAIYDINKWLLKYDAKIDVIQDFISKNNDLFINGNRNKEDVRIFYEEVEEISLIINNLEKALNFINFYNYVIGNDPSDNILNLTSDKDFAGIYDYYNYDKDCDIIKNGISFMLNVEKNFNKEEAEEEIKKVINYKNVIRRNLISYTQNIINSRINDCFVTKQQPYYESSTNKYRVIEIANSLIGIAYHKLLLTLLIDKENYVRKICANPTCNNEFESKVTRRRLYCKNKECQKYRNAKKNRKLYHKKKKEINYF